MAIEFHASESSFEPFGQLFGRREQVYRYYRFSQSAAWEPAVNIYEDANAFYICVELAGLEKDEVAVEVADREIRIHGDRPVPIPCEQMSPECILRMEIDSGRFFRAIELPTGKADLATAAARLDLGYLWITVSKVQTPSPESAAG